MQVSQELLNLADEFKSLIDKILKNKNNEGSKEIHCIVLPIYRASCSSLSFVINLIFGSKAKAPKIHVDCNWEAIKYFEMKEYCNLSIINFRQIKKLTDTPLSVSSQRKIAKLCLSIHDLLDSGNAKLHAMLKSAA